MRLLWLTASLVLRALREGLLVRALAWPGLLTALTLVLSASAAGLWWSTDQVAVEEPELHALLSAEGLSAVLVADAQEEVRSGRAERGVWREEGHLVLGSAWGGRMQARIEGVLRQHQGSGWGLEVPPSSGRGRDLGPATRALMGLLGVLFVLYGAVFGAGSLHRDRADGTLDAERSLPIPDRWHALARVLASGLLLSVAMALSVGLMHGLIGLERPAAWLLAGSAGAAAGACLGVGLMAGATEESLSGPLTRAMTLSMGLLGAGWGWPELGRHLPISSLGALARDHPPTWTVGALLVLAVALSARRL